MRMAATHIQTLMPKWDFVNCLSLLVMFLAKEVADVYIFFLVWSKREDKEIFFWNALFQ